MVIALSSVLRSLRVAVVPEVQVQEEEERVEV